MAGSKKLFIQGLLIGAGVSLLVFFLSLGGFLWRWENHLLDFLSILEKDKPSRDIYLIEIDDKAYRDVFHSSSPLSRGAIAGVLTKIAKSNPRLIGVDISLDTETNEDDLFREALRRLNANKTPIVLASTRSTPAPLIESFSSSPFVFWGDVEYPISRDGFIRELSLISRVDDHTSLPSFPLSILAAGAGLTRPAFLETLKKSNSSRRTDPKPLEKVLSLLGSQWRTSFLRIHYLGDRRSFHSLGFAEIVGMPEDAFQPGNIFTDKIVLIGGTYAESRDFYATPKGRMSGIEIIANSVETLLRFNPGRPINHLLSLFFELAIVVTLAFFFFRFKPWQATLYSYLAIIPLAAIASYLSFSDFGRWLNFVPAALAVSIHDRISRSIRNAELERELAVLTLRLKKQEAEISQSKRNHTKRGRGGGKI